MRFLQLSTLLISFTLGATSAFANGKEQVPKSSKKTGPIKTICDNTNIENTHLEECEIILRNQNSTGVGDKILRATQCGIYSPVIHEVRYYLGDKCYAVTLSRNESEQLEIKTLVQERGKPIYQSGTSKDKTLITELDNFMRYSTVEVKGTESAVYRSLLQFLTGLSTSIDETLSKPYPAGNPKFDKFIKFYDIIKDKAAQKRAAPIPEDREVEEDTGLIE